MSLTDCDSVIKTMGDLIPRYNGNPKTLNYYIREVESVISLIEPGWQAHPVLISLIKSRLSGAAIDAIAYEKSLDSWPEVKHALLRRLGETRNEIQVMQELTRMRRLKSEDAETFGKRLRDILDTLFTVGKHTDKSYYESMVIEHYISQLEFNVGIGVRIMKPTSLELTTNPGTNTASTSQIRQKTDHSRLFPQNNYLRSINNNPPRLFNPNFVPQQNNMNSQQRQQWIQSSLPWKNSHQGHKTSGNVRNNFGHQPNVPQQNINPTQKVSDVSMRSVNKPEKPQFTFEELFYTPNENQAAQEAAFKVGETVYKQVAMTARDVKTKPTYKGPYKIIHMHPNAILISCSDGLILSLRKSRPTFYFLHLRKSAFWKLENIEQQEKITFKAHPRH
ncbi:unnamed protein product [Leptidea sinapis]|uniref:Uncharacterized protein n=1 Tax=Leptidea sinapis TaxID=189913 RepID=A0A5E4R325_9NEOP|nr:unnamed protein product [Leptidea sinapis]